MNHKDGHGYGEDGIPASNAFGDQTRASLARSGYGAGIHPRSHTYGGFGQENSGHLNGNGAGK